MKALSEEPRLVISAHYIIRKPAKEKYAIAGITRYMYYDIIGDAHVKIANSIDAQKRRISEQNRRKPNQTEFSIGGRLRTTLV